MSPAFYGKALFPQATVAAACRRQKLVMPLAGLAVLFALC